MSHYTYMVTNNINGKVYVGSHSWKGEGLDPNYYGSGTAITRAVKKYGKENFQVEVLYFYDTVEECRADEERILTEYNVKDCPHSYNLKNSAIGFTSGDITEDTKRKMREHKFSDEHRKKLSQALKGKTLSEEHRKNISQAMKGKTSDKHRKKLSQAQNYEKIPIVAIDKNNKVKIFESIIECARQLNLDNRNIYYCLKNRQKSTGGYIIKYLEQLESGIYEGIVL